MSCLRYDEQGGIIRTKFYGLYTVSSDCSESFFLCFSFLLGFQYLK